MRKVRLEQDDITGQWIAWCDNPIVCYAEGDNPDDALGKLSDFLADECNITLFSLDNGIDRA